MVPISGSEAPIQLTSGEQGATHSPVFNTKGTKVAWLALDKDGYESDRYISSDNISDMTTNSIKRSKIEIYDLTKHIRFTITQDWDRSPVELAVNSFL